MVHVWDIVLVTRRISVKYPKVWMWDILAILLHASILNTWYYKLGHRIFNKHLIVVGVYLIGLYLKG